MHPRTARAPRPNRPPRHQHAHDAHDGRPLAPRRKHRALRRHRRKRPPSRSRTRPPRRSSQQPRHPRPRDRVVPRRALGAGQPLNSHSNNQQRSHSPRSHNPRSRNLSSRTSQQPRQPRPRPEEARRSRPSARALARIAAAVRTLCSSSRPRRPLLRPPSLSLAARCPRQQPRPRQAARGERPPSQFPLRPTRSQRACGRCQS
jgi:hypothetical protein